LIFSARRRVIWRWPRRWLSVPRAQVELGLHGLRAVQREVEETRQEPVRCICATRHKTHEATRLRQGYRYAHNEEGKVADMDCLPESLKGRSYYHPTQEGREKLLAQRMEEIRRIRAGKRDKA